jgi:mono/diheme cytochrome c family protein
MDDPEWHIYYAVRTGIRYTGMPAWSQALSEQEMWKVTSFISRVEKLPPGAQDYWKKSFGTAPPRAAPEGEEHGDHHD